MCTLPMSSLPLLIDWMVNSCNTMSRLIICLSALIPASTGPFPSALAHCTLPNTFKQRSALADAFLSDTMVSDSNWMGLPAFCSLPASTNTSSSVISFFLSANCKKRWYTSSNFSPVKRMPNDCKRCLRAALPLRAVRTMELSSIPTSLGSIIS